MEQKTFNIGTVKGLTAKDCQGIIDNKYYIITFSRVYEVVKKENGDYIGKCIHYKKDANYTRRGRFFLFWASYINNIVGFELIKDAA